MFLLPALLLLFASPSCYAFRDGDALFAFDDYNDAGSYAVDGRTFNISFGSFFNDTGALLALGAGILLGIALFGECIVPK